MLQNKKAKKKTAVWIITGQALLAQRFSNWQLLVITYPCAMIQTQYRTKYFILSSKKLTLK
jgi:hypothetical protein